MTYSELVSRMCDAIETLTPEELVEVANENFGMNLKYISDDEFEDITDYDE